VATRPSFVVEDQSEVIDHLQAHLKPERRIDTHGAVVFLAGDRAYKLKRAVKFPYMDFSTVERRRVLCQAEVDINRRLAPEIYLGVEEVRTPSGTSDWLVVMRRFDEDGLLDRMADRRALTPGLMMGWRRSATASAGPTTTAIPSPPTSARCASRASASIRR